MNKYCSTNDLYPLSSQPKCWWFCPFYMQSMVFIDRQAKGNKTQLSLGICAFSTCRVEGPMVQREKKKHYMWWVILQNQRFLLSKCHHYLVEELEKGKRRLFLNIWNDKSHFLRLWKLRNTHSLMNTETSHEFGKPSWQAGNSSMKAQLIRVMWIFTVPNGGGVDNDITVAE